MIWDDSNFRVAYKDEYTQDILPHKLIKDATIEDLTSFNEHVWEAVTMEEIKRYKDWKLVRTFGFCVARATMSTRSVGPGWSRARSTNPTIRRRPRSRLDAKRALFIKYACR